MRRKRERNNMATCRACGKEIYWLRLLPTDKNPDPKSNPIDMAPNPNGSLVIDVNKGMYRFATGNEKEVAKLNGRNLYISHFETCPNADRFRSSKPATEKVRDEPLFE